MNSRAVMLLILLLLFLTSGVHLLVKDDAIYRDSISDVTDLVLKNGYPIQVHKVVTPDDYVITLHRIPYGRWCGKNSTRRSPVLLIPGLFCSSYCWIIGGPENSLGFILADECYDVWMINMRGTTYSRDHATLSILDPRYWDFSWHEMGAYDVPSSIDYILDTTGRPALHCIGHSQGTTSFFVFNSLYPSYSGRIKSFQALSPVAYVGHMHSPIPRLLSVVERFTRGLQDIFSLREYLPTDDIVHVLGRQICSDYHPVSQLMCSNVLFLACGVDSEQLNTTLLPVIYGHLPAGASTKQLNHFLQNLLDDSFKQYDHALLNIFKYGSLTPPSYDISNIRAPVVLHYSLNDWLVSLDDMERLASQLPNLIGRYQVPLAKFNHLDFLWAIDVVPLLYNKVVAILEMQGG